MTLDAANLNGLWARYVEDRNLRDRNALLEHYMPLVRRVAANLRPELAAHVEYDDLVSYGTFGLIDAISTFEPARGARFTSFAWKRIRGSIFDHLRRADDVQRSVRSIHRRIANAQDTAAVRLQRTPTLPEIADELGMDEDEFTTYRAWTALTEAPVSIGMLETPRDRDQIAALEENLPGNDPDPHDAYEVSELREVVVDAWNMLPPRERTVLSLRYVEGLDLAAAGEVLGVAPSRVSQVASDAIRMLRTEISTL